MTRALARIPVPSEMARWFCVMCAELVDQTDVTNDLACSIDSSQPGDGSYNAKCRLFDACNRVVQLALALQQVALDLRTEDGAYVTDEMSRILTKLKVKS